MQADPAVVDRWRDAAHFWEKHRETIRQMFAPVAQALAQEAGIGGGQTVLDVATGPGEPALSIAALAGPDGKVIGVDPIPGMVEAARRAAEQQGLRNTEFQTAFADALPFPADSFDAVISRFGVMFFPSPSDAAREMLRVLKPGRKLALAVWGASERNPFFETLTRILRRYADSPPAAPDAPDAFRFASPGKLRDVLSEAGAKELRERVLRFRIEAPISAEDFWTVRSEMSDSMRQKLAMLPKEHLAEVRRQSLEAIGEYATEGEVSFPAEALIVSGTKGGPA